MKLLTDRQSLEQIKFQLDQMKEKAGSYHRELFNTPFFSMGEGESIRFYTEAKMSELNLSGVKEGSLDQAWFIKSYSNGVVGLQTGGKVIGKVPKGLPGFSMPKFEWSAIMHLIGAAITISLIGFMEAISIAKAMAARTRQSLSADRELIGQGMSNIIGSMFQSYPVSGSFSRSAVNINAGAVTGFSSVSKCHHRRLHPDVSYPASLLPATGHPGRSDYDGGRGSGQHQAGDTCLAGQPA